MVNSNIKFETHNLFVIAELEVILYDMIFVLLDLILLKFALLNLRKVPSNNILPSRRNNCILFQIFALVKPKKDIKR